MSNMSSFWAPKERGDATPVSAVTGFSQMASSQGGFRSRFGATGEGTGWSAAQIGMPDHLPPEPEHDPIEQASQEGFVMGFQEGERITREAMEADDTARLQLAQAISQLGGMDEGSLASLLSTAVLRLVTQIVGEVPVDEARLAERCAAVAAHIDPDDGKAVLEVNPEDVSLIDGSGLAVALKPNREVLRGCVRLATSDGWIEDGPDVRLSRLKAMMDDMEGRL
ncbi:MAG TPA: flagellar biosynthesis protein [Sphingobium sp.]|uniref:FliH/SctL family protein n=1 Tax=Sphingobium sp. TaxID=1912891 RepID=UPI002ED1C336